MAGKFIKGALIEFRTALVIPVPNVVMFQFNPETMSHAWTSAAAAPARGAGGPARAADPLAVHGEPEETFSFTLHMDASQSLADADSVPVSAALASVSGIYSRLAALEMLQYPVAAAGGGLLGSVTASVSAGGIGAALGLGGGGGKKAAVPRMQVPTVLFVWGPGRIVPVKVTSLTINETLYDALLNPTHAEAQVGLKVLTKEELKGVKGTLGTVASAAYTYSHSLREALAIANLGNAAESIIGMLPL